MKRLLIFLLVTSCVAQTHAQFVHKIKADSVLITNDSCTAELNLENSTKNIKGFLYNKGNGRTEFRKAVALSDSTFVFGEDTLLIRGSGGSLTNGNGTTVSGTWPNQTIDWGGAISAPINLTSSNEADSIVINGIASGSASKIFKVINSATSGSGITIFGKAAIGTSVFGENTAGTGVTGTTSTGSGVQAHAFGAGGAGLYAVSYSTGNALHAISGSGLGIYANSSLKVFHFETTHAFFPSSGIHSVGTFTKRTVGSPPTFAPGTGYGMSIDYNLSNNIGTSRQAAQDIYKWTDATDVTRSAQWEKILFNNGTSSRKIALTPNGSWIWDGYTGTNLEVADTTTYKPLAIDASGNVRKLPNWFGSGSNAPRVSSIASSSTITPSALTDDVYAITALAENTTIAAPSGTFHDGQIIVLRVKDNGTSRTISWNATYRGGTSFYLPTSTEAGKTMYITFIWNSSDSKLDGVGLSKGY